MFEKEIILEEQLAARCLFQCSPARKLPANANQDRGFRAETAAVLVLIEDLQDGVVSDRLEDPDFINRRIAAVTPKPCAAELREYLPEEVYRQLAGKEFEPLRQSLRDLFAEWLKQ